MKKKFKSIQQEGIFKVLLFMLMYMQYYLLQIFPNIQTSKVSSALGI